MTNDNESTRIAKAMRMWFNERLPLCKRDKTGETYKESLRLFAEYLDEVLGIKPERLSGESFSVSNIRAWIKWLKEVRGCCNNTCNNRLSALRSFLKYLAETDLSFLFIYEESLSVSLLPVHVSPPVCISKEAVKDLLATPDIDTEIGRRDFVMMSMLYSFGARIGEVLRLTVDDLHLDVKKPFAQLHGKGGSKRIAYILPSLAQLIKGYLSEFHGERPQGLLFFSNYGGTKHELSQDAVAKRLKIYAALAHEKNPEIPLNFHSHLYRHARASHWLEDGLNVVIIQALLGHKHLDTTMRYIGVSLDQMLKALEKAQKDEERSKEDKEWRNKEDNSLVAFLGLKQ